MREDAVGAPGAVEEYRLLRTAAPRGGAELVASLVTQGAGIDVMAFRGACPPARRHDDGDRLGGDQLRLVDRLRGSPLDDAGAPLVAEFFRDSEQFVLD